MIKAIPKCQEAQPQPRSKAYDDFKNSLESILRNAIEEEDTDLYEKETLCETEAQLTPRKKNTTSPYKEIDFQYTGFFQNQNNIQIVYPKQNTQLSETNYTNFCSYSQNNIFPSQQQQQNNYLNQICYQNQFGQLNQIQRLDTSNLFNPITPNVSQNTYQNQVRNISGENLNIFLNSQNNINPNQNMLLNLNLSNQNTFTYQINNNNLNPNLVQNYNTPNLNNQNSQFNNQNLLFQQQSTTQNQNCISLEEKNSPSKKKTKNNANLKLYTDFESMAIIENKFSKEMIDKFSGKFYTLLKNQEISKLSQALIKSTPQSEVHLIFEQIQIELTKLLLEPYANYFCMKLFIYLSKEDREKYLKLLYQKITILSTNKISTYPIQFLIENMTEQNEQMLFVNLIKPNFLQVALDLYGCHVIEKIINNFEYITYKEISKLILDNFILFSNHSNGLCIIKKFIEKEYLKDYFLPLKQILITNAVTLVQNPFGNYAIQIALDFWQPKDYVEIIQQFLGKTLILSIQKFSSNVIEKCIELSENFLFSFLNEVYINDFSGLKLLLENNYGNYVINKALSSSKEEIRTNLIKNIENIIGKITDKKIIRKWKNILSNYLY